jgi:hypothetical protein
MLSGPPARSARPSPLDVEIEDIAHGLARVARWNGQTSGAHIFSVAQHTLLVEAIARRRTSLDRRARLAILLHDAPEYVIGDMITPFKAVIGDSYKAVERGCSPPFICASACRRAARRAHAADQERRSRAAYLEATRLAGFGETEAQRFFWQSDGKCPRNSSVITSRRGTPTTQRHVISSGLRTR